MKKTKILVADDEPDVLVVLERQLSNEGYDVVTACDGEEALAKIYQDAPDVILLDIRMPKMNGFDVLKKIRDNPIPNKWQPVIIVSALGDLENMKKGYNLEADYYLPKPCDVNVILRGIKTMLSLIPQRKTKQEIEKSNESTK